MITPQDLKIGLKLYCEPPINYIVKKADNLIDKISYKETREDILVKGYTFKKVKSYAKIGGILNVIHSSQFIPAIGIISLIKEREIENIVLDMTLLGVIVLGSGLVVGSGVGYISAKINIYKEDKKF